MDLELDDLKVVVTAAGKVDHDALLAPATTFGKNIAPRVAALLDVMVISDVSAVVDADTFERPIYAGNAVQTVKSSDAKKVVTFRTSTFDAADDGGSAPVETIGAGASKGRRGKAPAPLSRRQRGPSATAKRTVSSN